MTLKYIIPFCKCNIHYHLYFYHCNCLYSQFISFSVSLMYCLFSCFAKRRWPVVDTTYKRQVKNRKSSIKIQNISHYLASIIIPTPKLSLLCYVRINNIVIHKLQTTTSEPKYYHCYNYITQKYTTTAIIITPKNILPLL